MPPLHAAGIAGQPADPRTLADFLGRTGPGYPSKDLAKLILGVADACAEISSLVRSGAAAGVLGDLASLNVQGETQKPLDVLANEILLRQGVRSGVVAAMASEEMETISVVQPLGDSAPYLLLFDPLDGSSNIDVNVSIGTIFSILQAPARHLRQPVEADFLQPGDRQVAGGYAVYGPQTSLVLSFGAGVCCFTLEADGGAWTLTHDDLRIPTETQEFSINMSNMRFWAAPVRSYIEDCLAGAAGPRGKNFNMRWVASMVSDVHRILMRGGIFLYPWDAREPTRPGKLRLMYEANPISFVVEQAGGRGTDGTNRILSIQPAGLHDRVGVVVGSSQEVEQVGAARAALSERGVSLQA